MLDHASTVQESLNYPVIPVREQLTVLDMTRCLSGETFWLSKPDIKCLLIEGRHSLTFFSILLLLIV